MPGFADDEQFVGHRIGSPAGTNDPFTFVPFEALMDADGVFHKADTELADGVQDGVTGHYNQSGKTVAVGEWVWLVGAAS